MANTAHISMAAQVSKTIHQRQKLEIGHDA